MPRSFKLLNNKYRKLNEEKEQLIEKLKDFSLPLPKGKRLSSSMGIDKKKMSAVNFFKRKENFQD